ncbi:hypothetical protein NEUTE1DRAFT_146776 [Neurospora tetrasperma FGSC 2508]|uniref:Uncharacterized protein n=1 Tax=Neurospora tetrasperma (strain FGSC 2508 / ATCC MYA-4615 / P0657) TaxID=510951 RepID=F8MLL7_NEUT8|nr:uncharacterized protein NEUTE1DRAFT_146776 [Neurospora tetrasperma FGSC 2508]EGO58436.1 hypothetical protein NEUTE1DRAFT_146776 [Neurospora tetrasperma FGSC 2508]EGZ71231.1 hypothetical protein NEUTE2DRAFT_166310 [Neurospora tetrasperma FGSC 2509]
MSSNSKPKSPAQTSRKRPLTRSEEENAENVEEVQKRMRLSTALQSTLLELGDLYKQQEKRIEKAGPIRRCFMALFNTSYIGINADKEGWCGQEGKKRTEQHTSRRRSSRRTTRVNLGRATASRYTSVQLPTTARELAIFTSSTSQPF